MRYRPDSCSTLAGAAGVPVRWQSRRAPPGVPIKGLQILVDEAQGTAVVLQFFDSAADRQAGSEVFAAMDPAETPGTRVSVDTWS